MQFSRRTLLTWGLAGTSVLAVGGGCLLLYPGVESTAARPLKYLSPKAFSALAALVDCLCPGAPGLPSGRELLIAEAVDEQLATMDPGVAGELHALLAVMENALPGVLLDLRFQPFSTLSPERQREVLEGWKTSQLHLRRMAFKGLSTLVNAAYWGHPQTFGHHGYPGPPDLRSIDVEDA